jgi:hypothetical protein
MCQELLAAAPPILCDWCAYAFWALLAAVSYRISRGS